MSCDERCEKRGKKKKMVNKLSPTSLGRALCFMTRLCWRDALSPTRHLFVVSSRCAREKHTTLEPTNRSQASPSARALSKMSPSKHLIHSAALSISLACRRNVLFRLPISLQSTHFSFHSDDEDSDESSSSLIYGSMSKSRQDGHHISFLYISATYSTMSIPTSFGITCRYRRRHKSSVMMAS